MIIHKYVIIGTGVSGLISMFVCPLMFWVGMPAIIRAIVKNKLYIHPDCDAYDRFVDLPVGLRWSMYFFNVTNPEAFDNSDRSDVRVLRFNEVGPYVYDERRYKKDVNFSKDGNNVTFTQMKRYTFNPVLSKRGLHPTDRLTLAQPIFVSIIIKTCKNISKPSFVLNFFFFSK